MYRFFFLLLLFMGCSGTSYRDPNTALGSTEWGPMEIRSTVDTMVGEVSSYFQNSKEKPYVELSKIQNKSSEHIDTGMLANEIATNLIKRKIVFVDRSQRADAIEEIKLGQRGFIKTESQVQAGEFLSPNFKLTGEISDNVRYDKEDKIQYIVVTLRLIKMSTGAVEWQGEKKFLKVTDNPKIGW